MCAPPPKKYIQLNVTLLGSRVLVTRIKVQVKMRSSWSRRALNPVGPGVLVRGDMGTGTCRGEDVVKTQTQRGAGQAKTEGDESDAASSHGTPRAPRSGKRQEGPCREPPEGAWPCQLLDFAV